MDKNALGWSEVWDHHLENMSELSSVVRIVSRQKKQYTALTTEGNTINCQLPGKMLHDAVLEHELPAVGDWCIVGESYIDESNEKAARIERVLERRSSITRMMAGTETNTQVLAANVDYVFIVTSLNRDFNIERLRRYLFMVKSGGIEPVTILSKVDLMERSIDASSAENDDHLAEPPGYLEETERSLNRTFPNVPFIKTSAFTSFGIEKIVELIASGKTAVFVGSSGVGKSTLVNCLLNASVQRVRQTRTKDDAGRHTTSSSGLFFLPSGGMIIDTPGLRELQLHGTEEQLDEAMPSVSTYASNCKFRNCTHSQEPGCAVMEALDEGALAESDYASYRKFEREVAYGARRVNDRLASEERKKWKRVAMDSRRRYKHRAES